MNIIIIGIELNKKRNGDVLDLGKWERGVGKAGAFLNFKARKRDFWALSAAREREREKGRTENHKRKEKEHVRSLAKDIFGPLRARDAC
jgi:hypothetical protein